MNEKEESIVKLYWKEILTISIIVLIIICLLPFTLTLPANKFSNFLHLKKANEIGDAIGGMVNPFLSLLGSVLLYITVKEQIKANREILNNRKSDSAAYFMDKFLALDSKLVTDSLVTYKSYLSHSIEDFGRNNYQILGDFECLSKVVIGYIDIMTLTFIQVKETSSTEHLSFLKAYYVAMFNRYADDLFNTIVINKLKESSLSGLNETIPEMEKALERLSQAVK